MNYRIFGSPYLHAFERTKHMHIVGPVNAERGMPDKLYE